MEMIPSQFQGIDPEGYACDIYAIKPLVYVAPNKKS